MRIVYIIVDTVKKTNVCAFIDANEAQLYVISLNYERGFDPEHGRLQVEEVILK